MAPSKDVCGVCSRNFFGKQKKLPCKGPCSRTFHIACIDVDAAELDFYMVDGVSKYTCSSCGKIPKNDSTPVSSSAKISKCSQDVSRSDVLFVRSTSPVKSSVEVSVSGCPCGTKMDKLLDLVASLSDKLNFMADKVSSMGSEIVGLRAENSALVDTVRVLSDRLESVGPVVNEPTFSEIISRRAKGGATGPKKNVPAVDKVVAPKAKPSYQAEVGSVSGPVTGGVSAGTIGKGEWTTVKSTKRNHKGSAKSSSATSKASRLRIVGSDVNRSNLVRQRRRALFVTRFVPETSVQDVQALVTESSGISTLDVTRLKTKNMSYNSFHISVNDTDFDKVVASDVWPSGVLVLPFYGKLKDEQKFSEKTTEKGKVITGDE